MNLCYRFPSIYWDCACAITDSGDIGTGTDYNKVAITINKMRNSGVNIKLPDINKSAFGFKPDVTTNTIFCGLKSLTNVGDEVVVKTIENRPYTSIEDYYEKVAPNKQAMISLIKGGAFDGFMERKAAMAWFIWNTCDRKKRLTLANLPSLIKNNLLPEDTEEQILARRVYEFNRYLKSVCKINSVDYQLDERAIDFLVEIQKDNLIEGNLILKASKWDKVYQKYMDIFREWIKSNKEVTLAELNGLAFKADWLKYAEGTVSDWEMDSLCFYYHEHPLAHIQRESYGLSNYFLLPEEPEVDRTFRKGDKEIKLFKLTRLCGTCIAKDKNKSIVTLLTPDGVVTVKFPKGLFSIYDKQISITDEEGVKHVAEKSWFNRGTKLIIQGVRMGEEFFSKNYNYTGLHQIYKIEQINKEGNITLRHERIRGEEEEVA